MTRRGKNSGPQLINLKGDKDVSLYSHLFPFEAFYNQHLEVMPIFFFFAHFPKAHQTVTSGLQLHIIFIFISFANPVLDICSSDCNTLPSSQKKKN